MIYSPSTPMHSNMFAYQQQHTNDIITFLYFDQWCINIFQFESKSDNMCYCVVPAENTYLTLRCLFLGTYFQVQFENLQRIRIITFIENYVLFAF